MTTDLAISSVLLCVIVGFEMWRRVRGHAFGLLSVANIVFALNFCVSPLLLALLPGTDYAIGPYGQPLFILPIVEKLGLAPDALLMASSTTVLAYAAMVLSYSVATRNITIAPLHASDIPVNWLMWWGVALGALAIVALLIYSSNFKDVNFVNEAHRYSTVGLFDDGLGIMKMMKLGMLTRVGKLDVNWGFLQIIATLGIPALMMTSAAGLRTFGHKRAILLMLAVVIWCAIFARTYHAAGRMELAAILALVPLAIVLSIKNKMLVAAGAGGLFVLGVFIGIAHQQFFPEPGQISGLMIQAVFENFGRVLLFLVNEFAFPYPVSAHTLQVVPESVDYRYFVDIPLSMLYMLPSLGGVDTWPEMISHIHERIVPLLLPYDLISFGVYSWGFLGVAGVFVLMGVLLSVFDKFLSSGGGWLVQCLRAAWMMYLPFRIMYADPYTSMKTGFGLIVGTMIILAMSWVVRRKATVA